MLNLNPNKGAEADNQVKLPSVSLPKGGGASRSIGEKFAANPVTGTASLSVPIFTTQGRSGFSPELSLTYDSGAGNGPFGFGWNLSVPSITRKTDLGLPQYHDARESDVFILSGAEDLVPVLVDQGEGWQHDKLDRTLPEGDSYTVERYRPRIEGLFSRIERWANLQTGETHWRSISSNNVTTLYGSKPESRITDPADPTRIFCWLICESYDDKGNVILYEYVAEDSSRVDLSQAHEKNRTDKSRSAKRYLKRVKYGNQPSRLIEADSSQMSWLFELVFDYDEGHCEELPVDSENRQFVLAHTDKTRDWAVRKDVFSSYRAGFEIRTYRLCHRVLMFHHMPDELGADDYLVSSTEFTYDQSPIASFITGIRHSGYVRKPDDTYLKQSLPSLEFEYSQAVVQNEVRALDKESLRNLPYGIDGTRYQWVDLDGEGMAGVLTEQAEGWFYKRNLSPLPVEPETGKETVLARFAPVELVAHKPSLANINSGLQQFLDLAGAGRLDLVQFSQPLSGYYERTQNENWSQFVPFEFVPAIAWDDPNLRFIDLTGDGHADILISEDGAFTWYPSLAEAGFGKAETISESLNEEKGPRLVFADDSQSAYLADLSGDGLTDLVRIRNGEICYWPNLGYGRFGAKVTMDNAPWFDSPDQLDHRRIRLADIDGSGATDIIYLGRDGIYLYFNQSGNSFSEAHRLKNTPQVDNLSSVTVTDLLGNGTACLVWSSPLPGDALHPVSYVDLMGGQRPHLLVKIVNNLGAESHIQYAPSTRFYLADKMAGEPWITSLPFPVHVLERVENYDRISRNRFVTRYAYHHGYFDGIEREFRGFGMVEQWDTEEFAILNQSDAFPDAVNIDEASHIPPTFVRTWFHTGAYIEGTRISRQFEKEYYRESDKQLRGMLLDDTVLPADLSPEEEREACRALKGKILRQEVYALDGTEEESRPYSVSESNYTITLLQPLGENNNAVFFAHQREAIDFHYERKLYEVGLARVPDPRVRHAMTLAVDDFGNVLQSVAINYGRRHDDPGPLLTAADRDNQKRILVTYTEHRYTNPILHEDAYRAPLPAETRTYEMLKVTPAANDPETTNLFRFGEMSARVQEAGDGGHDIPYEDVAGGGAVEDHPFRRLIEHVRTLYRRDDLTGPLPQGQIESLALPHESFKLALTPGLVAQVYDGRVDDSILADEGRYVHSDGDPNWWMPSGRAFYSPGNGDTAAQELSHARQHFFLPCRFHDSFDNVSSAQYDAYDLLLIRTTDPLGNVAQSNNDYRVLQPRLIVDPNGNRAEVAFDALGMVVGVAARGKADENRGDSLEGFNADLNQAATLAHIQDPLAEPHAILQDAGTRIVYDRFAYHRTRNDEHPRPAVVYTLARETHASDLPPDEQTRVQHSFSYSDGFGREIQKKLQVEPGPLDEDDLDVSPRWVGSGWTVFNNKGKPVKQYEPFFSATHQFEFARTVGVSSTLFYDPVERVVATLHPNHTWAKTVFDPWRQETWDVNDTVLIADPNGDPDAGGFFGRLPDSEYLPAWHGMRAAGQLGLREQQAAVKAASHAGTPTVAHFDALGRAFITLLDNGAAGMHATRVSLDIEGNQREVIDANGRVVMSYDYDMSGKQIHQASMDAGERWLLTDVGGQPIRAWDNRGHVFRTEYDTLRRPVRSFVRGADLQVPNKEILFERTEYGEGQPNAAQFNLRTRVSRQFDGAGVATNSEYDFKGNLLRSTRQFTADYKSTPDWSADPILEQEVFTTSTTFDALNRPATLTTPDNSTIRPAYNEAGLVERVEANLRGAPAATTFVLDIDYNAKGQRKTIEYGSGLRTAYEYDPLTLRLTHLETRRGTEHLQNLSYTYDPVGNITAINDAAQQTVYFNNAVVEPHADYTYDALYQLITAAGREHIGQVDSQQTTWNDEFRANLPHPHDGQAMRRYTEQYEYDDAGNILSLIHQAVQGSWTREYACDEPSLIHPPHTNNRLTSTTVSGITEDYLYDAHGNLTRMPHLSSMKWDFKEQLSASSRQVVNNGGIPETTYYVYGAGGQRIRKVIERQVPEGEIPTRKSERVYLGVFEVYREYGGNGETIQLERETLHVSDDQQRIALAETQTVANEAAVDSPNPVIRYQHGNHLNSACLEVDADGAVISYEEYHPYGTTAYQAGRSLAEVSLKRYRYSNKERDEETGLYYHGARYYASWLGRWCSADPKGISAGLNLYRFCSNNPIRYSDPDGMAPVSMATPGFDDSPDAVREFFKSGYDQAEHLRRAEEVFADLDATGNEKIHEKTLKRLSTDFKGRYGNHFKKLATKSFRNLDRSLTQISKLGRRSDMPLAASFVIGFREAGANSLGTKDIPTTWGKSGMDYLYTLQGTLRREGFIPRDLSFEKGSDFDLISPETGKPIKSAKLEAKHAFLAHSAYVAYAFDRFKEVALKHGFTQEQIDKLTPLERNFWIALTFGGPGGAEWSEFESTGKSLGVITVVTHLKDTGKELSDIAGILQVKKLAGSVKGRVAIAARTAAVITSLESMMSEFAERRVKSRTVIP